MIAPARLLVLSASLLPVCGCATLTRGDGSGGEVVGGSFDRQDRIADRHCRRFGKQARVTGIVIHSAAVIFECVASDAGEPSPPPPS